MRLLVCGGRDFVDRGKLNMALDRIHATRRIDVLIHGAYRGADTLADEWAARNGIKREPYPADWNLGPAAGPQRNQRMIDEGKPDGVLAMPGQRGTADMIRRAASAGIRVWRPLG